MNYKKLSFGLGVFSIALGAAELLMAPRIARTLDAPKRKRLVRVFGVRELLTGVGLLGAPASATGVWGRVAGDALDLAALGAAAGKAPRNRAVWGSLAFVVGATALDVFVARGLNRTTGRTWPSRAHAPA
jgi:hypothetical protein